MNHIGVNCRMLLMTVLVWTNIHVAQGQHQNPWGSLPQPTNTDTVAWQRSYVEGFVWPQSIKQGDALTAYVSVLPYAGSQSYSMAIYRVKFPSDTVVQSFTNQQGQFFPLHAADSSEIFPGDTSKKPVDYKIGCRARWQAGARQITTTGWSSGLYYIKLTHENLPGGHVEKEYWMPFVVRATTPTSHVLCKVDISTYQAYNYWGGGSFYWNSQGPSLTPDSIIAMDRPLWRSWEWNMFYHYSLFTRTMESLGYTMDFCNNIDVQKSVPGSQENMLANYSMLVIWFHDEYWAQVERQNIEWFKGDQHHGNIARFAPNTCYRRVYWVGGAGEELYAKLKCVKDFYPATNDLRDQWRHAVPGDPSQPANPEAKFLAIQYENGSNISEDSIATEPSDSLIALNHWIFRGTGLNPGNLFGLGFFDGTWQRGIVSYELDNMNTGQESERLLMQILAQRYAMSRIGDRTYAPVLHQMVYAEDTVSNSRIFASGAGNWWHGFDSRCNYPTDVDRMKTITANIFDHFSGKKYIGTVWTSGPAQNALRWQNDIRLDGDVEILTGKYLVADNNTLTVDSSFFVNGTFEINGNVTIEGSGQLNVGTSGQIILMPGATLTLRTKLYTANSVTLTVPVNTTLRVQQPGELRFGSNSGLTVYGKLIAQGSSMQPVLFSTAASTPAPNSWNYISLYGGPDTLEYCAVEYGMQGIYVNNQNTNLIRNCTITSCGWSGILGINTTLNYGGLVVENCSFSGNGRAIGLSNAAADIIQSNLLSNEWDGMYQVNSSSYMTSSSVQGSGYAGVHSSGLSTVVFGDRSFSPGYNSIFENNIEGNQNSSEVTVAGGEAFIGYADEEGSWWGCNSIDRGTGTSEYLLSNFTNDIACAQRTYWGSTAPTDEDFYGPVDYSNRLSDPCVSSRLSIAGGKRVGTPIVPTNGILGDTLRLVQLVRRLVAKIHQEPDIAGRYLPLLGKLVGATGVISEMHVGGWENFLRSLRVLSRKASVHDLCNGLILQRRLQKRYYGDAIAFADSILGVNPSDRLWLLCQSSKMASYLALPDTVPARQLLASIRSRGNGIDSAMISFFGELIRIETMTRRATQMQGASSLKLQTAAEPQGAPANFALEQSYPNPFNPSTTIRFALPELSHVILIIYDVLGRKVAVLENGMKEAGYHSSIWNASGVSSGVYFARFTAIPQSGTNGNAKLNSVNKLLLTK